jgi:hypothetical protein
MAVKYYFSTDASAPVLNGTAGSAITVLDACLVNGYGSKTSAGWSKAYSGTNLAAYRMTTASPATGFYVRVNDTGTTAARLVGYETMSDVNTGTGAFPTSLQVASGLYLIKSNTADSTARPWVVIAENRSFYFFCFGSSTSLASFDGWSNNIFFGDFITRKAVDGYNCAIMGGVRTYTQIVNQNSFGYLNAANGWAALDTHYIARDYTGVGSAKQVGKSRIYRTSGVQDQTLGGTDSYQAFPDTITQSWNLAKIMVTESSTVMRGILPGVYDSIGGTQVGNWFDIIGGQGTFAGTSFLLMPVYRDGGAGRAAFQVSGNWY